MPRGRPRLFAVLYATILLAGCDKEPPFAPDDPSLSSVGSSSFNLTSTAVSHTQIDVSWKDVSSSETGYELWRSTAGPGGTFTFLVTTARNVISFSDAGLTAATQYCYRVRFFKQLGRKTSYSAFSSTSCATTQNAPAPPPGPIAPSGLNARPYEFWGNAVLVTWNDNSSDEEGFRVERASSDQGPWEQVVVRPANTTSQAEHNRPYEQRLCYRVIAFRGQAESVSNVDCTSLPAAPTDLRVTAVSGQAVDLAWTDNSAHEDSFILMRSLASGPYVTIGTVGTDVTTFHDGTVSADQTYNYSVRVAREGIPVGAASAVKAVTASAPPIAPSALSATSSGSTGVSMYWTDNSTNEVGFRVERSENGGTTWVEAGRVEWTGFFDGGRTSDREVCYRVIAFNGMGDSPASNMDCTTPPAAPTNLVATTVPGFAIDLTWSDNSSVEDGYVVQRLVNSCGYYYYYYCYPYYEVIATLGPNATSYRDAGLSPGQYHVYVVNAVKDGSHSDPSNEAGAYSDLPPAAASNLTAVAVTSTRIDLAWNDNSTDETNFYIYRCTGTEAACVDNNFGGIGSTGPDASTFSDTSVQPNTAYTYRIYSCNNQCAAPSNKASATTPP